MLPLPPPAAPGVLPCLVRKVNAVKFSLKKKTIVLVLCIAVMTSLFTIVVINKGISDVIEVLFWDRSTGFANLVSSEIDSDRLLRVQQAVREIYEQSEHKVSLD